MADNAELESFRRQWREEVSRRRHRDTPPQVQSRPPAPSFTPEPRRFPPTRHEASDRKDDDDEDVGVGQYDQSEIAQRVGQLSIGEADDDAFHGRGPQKEPESAMEHFERAVQKEAEGSLGDSLQHYRIAYRVCGALVYLVFCASANFGVSD